MEWAEIKAHWDAFRPELQNRWGRLSDEDLCIAPADRDGLVRCVIQRYGIDPEIAQRHVSDWLHSACMPSARASAAVAQAQLDVAAHSAL